MSPTDLPLEPIETASIDELRALQLQRLKQTLTHAYANSPVYRDKFDAAISAMKADGTLNKMITKWFGPEAPLF